MTVRALALAVLIVAAWGTAANPLGLSRDHLQRLAVGEIVLLDVLPPGGQGRPAQGGTGLALVHASPASVWRVLVDYPAHRGLYPRVVGAEVVEVDMAHALVRYVVGLGPLSFDFHVHNYPNAIRGRIDWHLAHERPNGLFRDTWGYWQIEPRGEDVLLTYAMAARTVLPSFITRNVERDGVVETLKAVRERAEQRR
jgi:ribosome-associated toxin RatA of RatAB toxin-antitoxin module